MSEIDRLKKSESFLLRFTYKNAAAAPKKALFLRGYIR